MTQRDQAGHCENMRKNRNGMKEIKEKNEKKNVAFLLLAKQRESRMKE